MSQSITGLTSDQPSLSDLSESNWHRLLKSRQRHLALTILAEHSGSVELADLAAEVAVREDGRDPDDEAAIKRIEIALHHSHVPIMDELGVIDYDAGSRSLST